MQAKQPKISQKLVMRSAIGLIGLAILIFAFNYFRSIETDLNGNATVDSAGMIAALQSVGDVNHVVVIKPDGTLIQQPGIEEKSDDRDVVWRPDGNAVFFASDRSKDRFTMFRWRPDPSAKPEQRSVGSRAQGAPDFLTGDAGLGANAHALLIMGGKVMDYDPKKPSLFQVLPPVDPKNRVEISGEEEGGGSTSAFEGVYANLGSSFRRAKWLPDKSAAVAVMRRDSGEVLIYQKLNTSDPVEGRPKAIVAGDRVDFDVDERTGLVYYAVTNFQWVRAEDAPPEFHKGNRLTTPFKHAIGRFDVTGKSSGIVTASKDDTAAFNEIRVDPQGKFLLVTYGPYLGDRNFGPGGLSLVPLEGAPEPSLLAKGDVHEPSWSPTGDKVLFALRESETSRPIMEVSRTGGPPVRKSPAGVFSYPQYSPQTK